MNPTASSNPTDQPVRPIEHSSANGQGAQQSKDAKSSTFSSSSSSFSSSPSASSSLHTGLINLKSELDSLLSRASTLSESDLTEACQKLVAKLPPMMIMSPIRQAAKTVAAETSRQLNHGMDVTSDYVRAKPLQSVGMAAGLALLMGMAYGRRR